jgi:hypothetical protein
MAEERSEDTSPEGRPPVGSAPIGDLMSAFVIGLAAAFALVYCLQFQVPGSVYTAPALLPAIVSLALLLMAIALGAKAVRHGALQQRRRAVLAHPLATESRRAIALTAIIIAYIGLLAVIHFDLRLGTPWIDLEFSGYEAISIGVVTLTMRLFSKKRTAFCLVTSFLAVEALASVFRYAFAIIMPQTF